MESRIEIVTPQAIINQEIRYAGFWLRLTSYLIDYALIILLSALIGMITGILEVLKVIPEDFENTLSFSLTISIVASITFIIYFSFLESSKRQATFGKMALGLKVTDLSGARIGFSKALRRNFLKIVSGPITLFVGYLIIAFTRKKQGLHDLLGKCVVIKVPRISQEKIIRIKSDHKSKIPFLTKINAFIVSICFITGICLKTVAENLSETNNIVLTLGVISMLIMFIFGAIGSIFNMISFIKKLEARRVSVIKFAINVISITIIILLILNM